MASTQLADIPTGNPSASGRPVLGAAVNPLRTWVAIGETTQSSRMTPSTSPATTCVNGEGDRVTWNGASEAGAAAPARLHAQPETAATLARRTLRTRTRSLAGQDSPSTLRRSNG